METRMRWIDEAITLSRQGFTPQGHLLCADTVIGRTGWQSYHITELPADAIDDGPGGMIAVERPASAVFHPDAIASFANVPVTLSHPPLGVDDSNRAALMVGQVRSPRRVGDHLVGDLLITRRDAIDAVRNRGWRSISLGYDAAYIRTGIGRARQREIRGNHCAILSPNEEARCGDVCRIADSVTRPEDLPDPMLAENTTQMGSDWPLTRRMLAMSDRMRGPRGLPMPRVAGRRCRRSIVVTRSSGGAHDHHTEPATRSGASRTDTEPDTARGGTAARKLAAARVAVQPAVAELRWRGSHGAGDPGRIETP
jgi:hypothetical protein